MIQERIEELLETVQKLDQETIKIAVERMAAAREILQIVSPIKPGDFITWTEGKRIAYGFVQKLVADSWRELKLIAKDPADNISFVVDRVLKDGLKGERRTVNTWAKATKCEPPEGTRLEQFKIDEPKPSPVAVAASKAGLLS